MECQQAEQPASLSAGCSRRCAVTLGCVEVLGKPRSRFGFRFLVNFTVSQRSLGEAAKIRALEDAVHSKHVELHLFDLRMCSGRSQLRIPTRPTSYGVGRKGEKPKLGQKPRRFCTIGFISCVCILSVVSNSLSLKNNKTSKQRPFGRHLGPSPLLLCP